MSMVWLDNEFIPPDPNCEYCTGTGLMDSGGVDTQDQAIFMRCNCTYKQKEEQ